MNKIRKNADNEGLKTIYNVSIIRIIWVRLIIYIKNVHVLDVVDNVSKSAAVWLMTTGLTLLSQKYIY
jgi:hypothetical protein